ncbi:DUF2889 domain-containing protein [Pelomonas sp. KK5]|uniref:DUF2889 domain-containing protein n=1 Tax=Pelomonas sp. KK5 TaxID=1855730 RepID=UPI00097BB47A|nr:DUF2889 domain-containing protein [Pelomonas sp. KK5]
MTRSTLPYRKAFGNGVFIRSLEIRTPAPGRVSLAMEDPVHSFRIDFAHEHGVVTEVQAAWDRHPLSSCTGAPDALQEMVGCPLSDSVFDIARFSDGTQQCTHLHDMFCIAATHAHQQRPDCRWDVHVPDATDTQAAATLARNGATVLALTLESDYLTIAAPEACKGLSVLRGFMGWVRANVPPEEHLHYFLMQKALFLAQIQKIDAESLIGQSAMLSGPPAGTCFGSQPSRYVGSTRVGQIRRFDASTGGEQLLKFFR